MNGRKMTLSVGSIGMGVVRIICGISALWGQYKFQEQGTLLGFAWPISWHFLWLDLRGLAVLLGAYMLVRAGMVGEERATTG
jgi:hypothetical protein